MSKYDYLIVGAGLFGGVFAREMTDRGKKCLVIHNGTNKSTNFHANYLRQNFDLPAAQ